MIFTQIVNVIFEDKNPTNSIISAILFARKNPTLPGIISKDFSNDNLTAQT